MHVSPSSSMSHDSDSDHVARKSRSSKRKKNESQRSLKLFDVFQSNYAALSSSIQLCTNEVADKLFSKGIIPTEVVSKVASRDMSASSLLAKLSGVFKTNPEKLKVFVDILKEERSLDDVTQKMSGKHSSFVIAQHLATVVIFFS